MIKYYNAYMGGVDSGFMFVFGFDNLESFKTIEFYREEIFSEWKTLITQWSWWATVSNWQSAYHQLTQYDMYESIQISSQNFLLIQQNSLQADGGICARMSDLLWCHWKHI